MRFQRFFIIIFTILMAGCASQQSMFNKAKTENSIESYKEFLLKYPDSAFSEEAEKLIKNLEYKKIKKVNTIESYKRFLDKYPTSEQAQHAKEYISMIKEIKSIRNNQELNTVFMKIIKSMKSTDEFDYEYLNLWIDALSKELPNKPKDILISDSTFFDYFAGFSYVPTKPKDSDATSYYDFFLKIHNIGKTYSLLFSKEGNSSHLYELAFLSNNIAKLCICSLQKKHFNEYYDIADSPDNYNMINKLVKIFYEKKVTNRNIKNYADIMKQSSVKFEYTASGNYRVKKKSNFKKIIQESQEEAKRFTNDFWYRYSMLEILAKQKKSILEKILSNPNLDSRTKNYIKKELLYLNNIFNNA